MNELTITQDQDKFLAELNKATGFSNNLPMLPQLKFDAEKGYWKKQTEKVDEEGKPIYEKISESIDFHLITTRKMVESKYSPNPKAKRYFSREYQDNYLTIFDSETKEEVFKGLYSELKEGALYPMLQYVQVLYAYFQDNLYRIKLSGTKLNGFFEYLNAFNNSNPALYFTSCSLGQKIKISDDKSYYELKFERGERVPQKKIVARVNEVNQYLSLYYEIANSKKKNGDIAEDLKEVQIDNIHEYEPKDEMPIEDDISAIPF